MDEKEIDRQTGWIKFLNTKKYHYVGEDSRTLCHKYLYFKNLMGELDDTNHKHPDNCKICQKRKLAALEAVKGKELKRIETK